MAGELLEYDVGGGGLNRGELMRRRRGGGRTTVARRVVLAVHLAGWLLRGGAAYDNGPMTDRPLLGWESWCSVGPCRTDLCTEAQVRETAAALVRSGLAAKGYRWVLLDNCWHPTRIGGELRPDRSRFPSGMRKLADYVHGLGLGFGLYTSVGKTTCHHHWAPGSYGYFERDARTFADWGIDYLKVDWCDRATRKRSSHLNFSRALNATGRRIVLELCRGPYIYEPGWGYAPEVAQIWRAAHDHHDDFNSTLKQVAALENATRFSGPHGWAYGDILMTGGQGCSNGSDPLHPHNATHCPKQTDFEYRTEITLYAVLSSPLMVGTDVRALTPLMRDLLFDDHLLFVQQDVFKPAYVATSCGSKAYVRHLSDGRLALAVPNLDHRPVDRGVCFSDVIHRSFFSQRLLPNSAGSLLVIDVWARTNVTRACCTSNYTRLVPPHDTLFLLVVVVAAGGPSSFSSS